MAETEILGLRGPHLPETWLGSAGNGLHSGRPQDQAHQGHCVHVGKAALASYVPSTFHLILPPLFRYPRERSLKKKERERSEIQDESCWTMSQGKSLKFGGRVWVGAGAGWRGHFITIRKGVPPGGTRASVRSLGDPVQTLKDSWIPKRPNNS